MSHRGVRLAFFDSAGAFLSIFVLLYEVHFWMVNVGYSHFARGIGNLSYLRAFYGFQTFTPLYSV